jgi:hypothetical protein
MGGGFCKKIWAKKSFYRKRLFGDNINLVTALIMVGDELA